MRMMFLGTSSNSGKTTVAAMMCRHAAINGISVAPFKASNLSSSWHITGSGSPIGIGQAFQAVASGIAPDDDMNPILLRPEKEGVVRYLKGSPCAISDDAAFSEVLASFDRIAGKYDLVVCEGSGSPVELNLKGRDIANMRMVRERGIPSVIVGDIERGGVFAAIYGTWKLIPEEDRRYLRGFVINRFRGDISVLYPGIEELESITGMRCFGVIPYADLRVPEEDTSVSEVSCREGLVSLDELLSACRDSVDLDGMLRISGT